MPVISRDNALLSSSINAIGISRITGLENTPIISTQSTRGVNIISIVIDAPTDLINSLSGKIGMLSGVNAKAIYSKITEENNG